MVSKRGFIENGETKEGSRSAESLCTHIVEIADSLSLTKEQENEILSDLGMSARISKNDERKRNLKLSLENTLSAGPLSSNVGLWQQAVDWNTSLALNKSAHNDAEATLVHSFSETLKLWRSCSPFTIIDGKAPQFELQTRGSSVVMALRQLTQRFLSHRGIQEITLHKALKWENNAPSIPMSENRPEWYALPAVDNTSDGYDEETSRRTVGASNILLSRYTGFTANLEIAVDLARHYGGVRSNYYAILSGTFPAESVVCIPTLGFGSLRKMEVVVDSSMIQSGSFNVVFGRKSS